MFFNELNLHVVYSWRCNSQERHRYYWWLRIKFFSAKAGTPAKFLLRLCWIFNFFHQVSLNLMKNEMLLILFLQNKKIILVNSHGTCGILTLFYFQSDHEDPVIYYISINSLKLLILPLNSIKNLIKLLSGVFFKIWIVR